jgi:hypothetical protein
MGWAAAASRLWISQCNKFFDATRELWMDWLPGADIQIKFFSRYP